MAKMKMLKVPQKPKLPKKPAATASLSTKQAWLRRAQDLKLKYEGKLKAIQNENKKRQAMNEASRRASTVISGIGDILEVRPGSFSAKIVRGSRTSKVSGTKRKTKTKATAKRKPAAKKKTTRRR